MEKFIPIIILAIVGILGIFAHAFKFTYDKNKSQETEYTFGMYLKKNRFMMYFVAICVMVFSYYSQEWTSYEKLGNWRGLIMFSMGYMGDSVFPSLFELLPTLLGKIVPGFAKKQDTPPTP